MPAMQSERPAQAKGLASLIRSTLVEEILDTAFIQVFGNYPNLAII
jgi:hypothetical protein